MGTKSENKLNIDNMKNILNKKNILAVVAGVLFAGLILNTVEQVAPKQVMSMNQAIEVNSGEETIKYVDSSEIQEKVLEEDISAEDAEYTRKVNNIRTYLQRRNAPLHTYAEEFVKAADTYGIDYRLAASISIIESSGGIHTFRTYNAWGWGKMNFSSWEEGIWTVSEGLGKYYAKGLNTPQKISRSYCPPSASEWARKVSFVMSEIEK